MKNFDEFSRGIKLNESEIKFLNEEETTLAELGESIVTHLEEADIKASAEIKEDGSLCIEVGGESFCIKKEGTGYVMSNEHNKDEKFKDEHELFSWWLSFVPSHKAGEADYHGEKANLTSGYTNPDNDFNSDDEKERRKIEFPK
jgi:hypothetical protein